MSKLFVLFLLRNLQGRMFRMNTPQSIPPADEYIPLSPKKDVKLEEHSVQPINTVSTNKAQEEPKAFVDASIELPKNLHNMDDLIGYARCKALEKQNADLKTDLERYKDKCEYLRGDISRFLAERNSARSMSESLSKQNAELLTRLTEEEKKVHQAKENFNEQQRLVKKSKQEVERLTQKVEKLEDMLSFGYNRAKEFKHELDTLRGTMQSSMFQPYSMAGMQQFIPQPSMTRFTPVHASEQASSATAPHPENIPDYDYVPPEDRSTKRKAGNDDLRKLLQQKVAYTMHKRLCYYGAECKYRDKDCNFAHSINELKVCQLGKKCNSRLRCGYMLHSEEERLDLKQSIKTSGKKEMLCEAADRFGICKFGLHCDKIHNA